MWKAACFVLFAKKKHTRAVRKNDWEIFWEGSGVKKENPTCASAPRQLCDEGVCHLSPESAYAALTVALALAHMLLSRLLLPWQGRVPAPSLSLL